MARLDDELVRLATLPPGELRQAWAAACGGAAPQLPPELLRRALAQRLQEKKLGRLPVMVARALAEVAAGTGEPPTPRTMVLRPGARLLREWQGQTISVEVVENGFVWNGTHHASLSSIAKLVTGAHWSGPRFFGLTRRG